MGRPTKLTLDLQAKLCKDLESGISRPAASARAGIPERTFYRWLKRGKHAASGLYWQFCQEIKKAEANLEKFHIDRLALGLPGWQSSAWLLERKWPERWGNFRAEFERLRRELYREIAANRGNEENARSPASG